MHCNYIGNNHFINVAVQNLVKEQNARSLRLKTVYFLDTGSVLTMHALIKQIIRTRKTEAQGCIVLIDNNDFIASVKNTARVSIKTPVREWVTAADTVKPNIEDLLKACMSILKLQILTDAQRRFVLNLQSGKSLMQIAKQLSISNKTAYAHRQAITETLSLLSPAHLAIYIKNESKKINIPIDLY